MANVHVNLGENSYDIVIERGLIEKVGQLIRPLTKAEKIAVITDDNVQDLYDADINESLRAAGFEPAVIAIAAGEESKSLRVLANVYEALSAFGLSRSDAIVTFGGGVPGDLGGFAAATYVRGVDFFQIPTTIMAQVDSSVGGKVSVDLPAGKNLAGTFYQPKGVFIDANLIKTLPKRYFHDGFSEVVKYGVIGDAELFEMLEKLDGDAALDGALDTIIERSVKMKRDVVEKDEFDNDRRQILNYGHTIGHAIESYFHYSAFTHGEAVAIGMSLMAEQTEKLGITKQGTAERIEKVLRKLHLPTSIHVQPTEFLPRIVYDKKRRGQHFTLAVVKEIGRAELIDVPAQDLEKYIDWEV